MPEAAVRLAMRLDRPARLLGAPLQAGLAARRGLVAERIAIESYGEMIRYIGVADPTTRRLLEDILSKEEEHAEELSSLLTGVVPSGSRRERSG